MKISVQFLIISHSFLFRMRNASDEMCMENQKTHFVFSSFFFFFENVENSVRRGKSQMTIWRMRNACWIIKATNTHTQVL
jgi:hypothetical protein